MNKDNKIIPTYDKNGDGTVQDLFGFRYGTTTYVDLKDTSYKHVNIMNNKNVISDIDNIIKLKDIKISPARKNLKVLMLGRN